MSAEEKIPEWAQKYLENFEERMKKLESPDKEPPDLAKEAEDEFIKMMQEINTDNQPGGGNNEEDDFINQMRDLNQ